MYRQGEIVLIDFPFTDYSGKKKRPALVISGNNFNKNSNDIILVPLTSVTNSDGNSIILKQTDLIKPLNHISEVRCHKIFVAEQNMVLKSISSVHHHIVKKTIERINQILSK